jgi:hypothetical protein
MAVDLKVWRTLVTEVVGELADENLQRRAWFGFGPEVSSPDDDMSAFFGDAAVEEFLDRDDTGLNETEIKAGRDLVKLMSELADRSPEQIDPHDLIDDPRWQKIREAAARFHKLLQV